VTARRRGAGGRFMRIDAARKQRFERSSMLRRPSAFFYQRVEAERGQVSS